MGITDNEIAAARETWGDGLVTISKAHEANGFDEARRIACDLLDSTYGFDIGPVLFKPTLSGGEKTFRTSRKGALSYFVGRDPDFPLDAGFALRRWRHTWSETAASLIDGNTAMWMGWFFFTDTAGKTVKTDKSFGYLKDADDVLRIVCITRRCPSRLRPRTSETGAIASHQNAADNQRMGATSRC
ncbi:hypothetical protein SAMN05421853_1133 [Roseivivax halotolerans]|uniref:Phosphoribosyl-AMP cyclohydrolase n=1 Tax=Roseivivax halotolerans TaxID=93684 RepID=A0A1I5ZXE9_9RHOB|nr:phosphoribosyl-AMP cyclohydrolase [Roseivivax halotolerans]SFQ61062.1 hypothetical protein SAMN05421853_1133 [Roseivivax halotolerans]